MSEMTLDTIEKLAQDYADKRALLAEHLAILEQEMNAVKQAHLKVLRRRVKLAAESQSSLFSAIEGAPDLFEKPKTQIFHGIKVGFRKGKGKIEWEDDATLVALIKKRFPDHCDELIITTEVPSATGLQDLDAADLRKLGVTVEEAGEQVVVKPVETDVERLVKALLKGALEETEDA